MDHQRELSFFNEKSKVEFFELKGNLIEPPKGSGEVFKGNFGLKREKKRGGKGFGLKSSNAHEYEKGERRIVN